MTKAEETRFRNLTKKCTDPHGLNSAEAALFNTLKAKKANELRGSSTKHEKPILTDVIAPAGKPAAERNWLTEPASPKWTGRKIRNKKSQKEYVIRDVFGEMHIKIENAAETTVHSAALLRLRYDPC
ncbi:MAG TPA: hypothetical protein VNT99_03585 [Methylomirabilota bacterium]|nr:hypothetical protein [Methylomirabilota bacterium]